MSGYAPEDQRRLAWEEWDYRFRPDDDEDEVRWRVEDMRDEVLLGSRARVNERKAA